MQKVNAHQKVTLAELAGVDFSSNALFDTYREPTLAEVLEQLPILEYEGATVLISQSMLKAYRAMQLGQSCSTRFFNDYITRKYYDDNSNDSLAKQAGRRFEYELTGGLDRAGEVPGELLTPSRGVPSIVQLRITANVEAAKQTFERLGFELDGAHIGETITILRHGLSGTLDMCCFRNDEPCIVDIKYSGLIGDKWNAFGWNDEHDTANHITRNQTHITQAVHYQLLEMLESESNEPVPFFFAIFDPRANHEGEYKFFEFVTTDQHRIQHLREITEMINDLQHRIDTGNFHPEPKAKRCVDCPVEGCAARMEWEPVQVVVIE